MGLIATELETLHKVYLFSQSWGHYPIIFLRTFPVSSQTDIATLAPSMMARANLPARESKQDRWTDAAVTQGSALS
jgi:hypothetical protein